MLLKRMITGFTLAALSIVLVCWGLIPMALEILLVSLFGLLEFDEMARKKGIRPSRPTSLFCGFLIVASSVLGIKFSLPILVLCSFIIFTVFIFRKEYHVSSYLDVGVTLMGIVYIPWLFSFMIHLRNFTEKLTIAGLTLDVGAWYVLLVFFGTSFSDIFAYFIGRFFGRVKLCPGISPGKTVEGSLAGLLASVAVTAAFGQILGWPVHLSVLLGLLLGVTAQLGDLWESILKRDAGVKDSGSILAGHGGILDRFDSYFFTAPAAYYFLILFVRPPG
ncbi:MAG: phosphatidate cytidylyltransferase [bacterium]